MRPDNLQVLNMEVTMQYCARTSARYINNAAINGVGVNNVTLTVAQEALHVLSYRESKTVLLDLKIRLNMYSFRLLLFNK